MFSDINNFQVYFDISKQKPYNSCWLSVYLAANNWNIQRQNIENLISHWFDLIVESGKNCLEKNKKGREGHRGSDFFTIIFVLYFVLSICKFHLYFTSVKTIQL